MPQTAVGAHDPSRPRPLARPLAVGFPALCLCLALAACGRAPRPHHAAAVADEDSIVAAARADMEADGTVPHGAPVRGISVWNQAMPGRVAVCGLVAPFKDEPGAYVPFISVMPTGGMHPVDRFVGRTTLDADRVYEALVGYCYDQGGPSPSIRPAARPTPPVPNAPNVPSAPAVSNPEIPAGPTTSSSTGPGSTSPAPTGPTPETPETGTVTMAQDGNLHDHPQGATLRVLAAGTVLHVFAIAPGGWYQVGAGETPDGWVHQSMLQK